MFYTQNNKSLLAIGSHHFFQFGLGGLSENAIPIKVLDENVTDATSGDDHSVILKTDGSLWSVGHDGEARLGNGGNDRHESEFQKIVDGNVTHISTFKHSLLVKQDGSYGHLVRIKVANWVMEPPPPKCTNAYCGC